MVRTALFPWNEIRIANNRSLDHRANGDIPQYVLFGISKIVMLVNLLRVREDVLVVKTNMATKEAMTRRWSIDETEKKKSDRSPCGWLNAMMAKRCPKEQQFVLNTLGEIKNNIVQTALWDDCEEKAVVLNQRRSDRKQTLRKHTMTRI